MTGDATIGTTVTVSDGEWESQSALQFSYAWLRCDVDGAGCEAIDGATTANYQVSALDAGAILRVRVTATRAGRANSALSTPSEPVSASLTDDAAASIAATVSDAGARLSLVNLANGALTTVANCASCRFKHPALSPDGTKVVVEDRGALVLVDIAGGQRQTLADEGTRPTFAPDGEDVLFARSGIGGSDLYVTAIDGTGVHALSAGPDDERDGAYASDGQTIAYVTSRPSGGAQIVLADAEGVPTAAVALPTDGPVDPAHPSLSPDGARVLFDATPPGGGGRELYVSAVDGSDLRRLTYSAVDDADPAWLADGRRLLYDHGGEAYVMRVDGSGATTLGSSLSNPSAAQPPRVRVTLELDGGYGAYSGGDTLDAVVHIAGAVGARSVVVSDRAHGTLVQDAFSCTPDCPQAATRRLPLEVDAWPEGEYTVQATVTDENGRAAIATAGIIIDRTAPEEPSDFAADDPYATWETGPDPDLPSGTPGSGLEQEEYRVRGFSDDDGLGDWSGWLPVPDASSPDAPPLEDTDRSGVPLPGDADRVEIQVRATDGVGNTRLGAVQTHYTPHGEPTATFASRAVSDLRATFPEALRLADPADTADGRVAPRLVASAGKDSGYGTSGTLTEARVGATASEGFSMTTSWGNMRVGPTGVADSAGTGELVDRAAVVYGATAASTDSVVRATARGVEQLLMLRDESAPETFSWSVNLSGGQTLKLLPTGDVAILAGIPQTNAITEEAATSPAGLDVLTSAQRQLEVGEEALKRAHATAPDAVAAVVPTPWAVDAAGRRLPAAFRVDGNTITLTISHRGSGHRYPLLADPDFVDCAGSSSPCGRYNGRAAAAYAKRWADRRNPSYPDYSNVNGGNDCTNFANQALFAGGTQFMREFQTGSGSWWTRTTERSPYPGGIERYYEATESWRLVQKLWTHLNEYKLIRPIHKGSSQSVMYWDDWKPGDLLFLNWGNRTNVTHHVAVVTGVDRRINQPRVSQHSTDRKHITWAKYNANIHANIPGGVAYVWHVRPVRTAANIPEDRR